MKVSVKPVPAASTRSDLARAQRRNGLLFRQFQDFRTAEPSNTDTLPRHAPTVSAIVVGVMLNAAGALTGSLRE